ncbi:SDR family NAD(P)-dependent oxidoreductase [Pseudomonas savastanoi]|nr:SDR family oxidoreductase [Pseudomonas savastanoi]
MSLNVTSVFYISKLVEAKVRAAGASLNIVNIASVSGTLGEPNRTAYVTSKHALIGLTKQLAIEYGRFGVRVNAISPGVIRTPLTEHYFTDHEQMSKIMGGQFLEKTGTTEDVANAVLYLASNQASFITGSNFVVDGGWSAGKLI